jgi:hypothetical protein
MPSRLRRQGPNIIVPDFSLVNPRSAGGGGPPTADLGLRLRASSAVLSGSDIDSIPDESGNGRNAVASGTKGTFIATGVGGNPAWHLQAAAANYTLGAGGYLWGAAGTIYIAWALRSTGASDAVTYPINGGSYRPFMRTNVAEIYWGVGGGISFGISYAYDKMMWWRFAYTGNNPAGTAQHIKASNGSEPTPNLGRNPTVGNTLTHLENCERGQFSEMLIYDANTVADGTDADVISYLEGEYSITP